MTKAAESVADAQKKSEDSVRLLSAGTNAEKNEGIPSCEEEHKNSLKCIEKNYSNKQVCRPLFDAYKNCKKARTEARLLRNNGGKKATLWD
ncbi:Cytochrome c oxidase-assembly factor COX23, mitochondrial [Hondaea fermentalgiana]|uniref:Cytochrome c oxidase-assembly factor COX23, mitochondrial n=1 Tax=Hondaea fermentalgiana TaxID=2315210 RepID=A0A2R5GRA2_9STRA|nr:Cytochrome c oxidase-assembly factor COX23, mitochondrial [Hondaea fermentalgiana]|eukprot:GBG31163.1 Cytochrome c oxidase-assembly factor COX23, mitochondrial [Hondaea fermentalgiana]